MRLLITGGAGFIGSNIALHFMKRGHKVIVLDDLSRFGTEANLNWLQENGRLTFIKGDIRDYERLTALFKAYSPIDVIIHLASQVAVTTSVRNSREDFEVNALGTFNVLEAARHLAPEAILLYASTNKVYGEMEDVAIVERNGRYEYERSSWGASEQQPLDFHSPYGCSKGAADQYVRDYARIYGQRTVVFRQSCIYGYRQLGLEDQGWVAWLAIAALLGKPITIYGNGKQVRDLLFITDLVDLYQKAIDKIEIASGNIYNIGGGPEKQGSLLEVLAILEELLGKSIPRNYAGWRPGDQRVCVMDISKAHRELGWRPLVGIQEGIERLFHWVAENEKLFTHIK